MVWILHSISDYSGTFDSRKCNSVITIVMYSPESFQGRFSKLESTVTSTVKDFEWDFYMCAAQAYIACPVGLGCDMNPLAILSLSLETVPGPSHFFTFSNMVKHMVLMSPPSSNSPCTLTTSPCGPSILIVWMNGMMSESFALCPTMYRSVILNSLLFEIHDVCSVGMKVLSPHATSAHVRTMGSLRLFMWVICLPLKLMTLPLFPVQPALWFPTPLSKCCYGGAHIYQLQHSVFV